MILRRSNGAQSDTWALSSLDGITPAVELLGRNCTAPWQEPNSKFGCVGILPRIFMNISAILDNETLKVLENDLSTILSLLASWKVICLSNCSLSAVM